MSNIQPRRVHPVARILRKFFVSGFVVCTFVAYALHERFGAGSASAIATPLPLPVPTQIVAQPTASALPPKVTSAPTPAQAAVPTAPPPTTAPPAPVPAVQTGLYRNGSYNGSVTDAYYGNMQVQAIIQAGKLASVQILEFPNDRRTSIRINNIALPYLIDEAIKAQSSNVDVISGATLTSEAFAQSLQTALETAKAQGTT